MYEHLIGDLHLDHDNIRDYCDRPFETVEEMNQILINNWNSVVSETDSVLYFGDLAMTGELDRFKELLNMLNGNIDILLGNHDDVIENMDRVNNSDIYNWVTINYKNINFFCTHRPENIPEEWNEWKIIAHIHNNDIDNFPFVNQETKTVVVSAELIRYYPVRLTTVCDLISKGISVKKL